MSKDLDILIDFYQLEIKRIQAQIKENLESEFYEEVEWDFPRLGHLKRELDVLLTLKDSKYPERNRIENRIEFFQKRIDKNPDLYSYLKSQIEEDRKQLSFLEKIPLITNNDETQLIDEYLYNLLSNKIKGFKIHLNFEFKLYIKVSLTEETENFEILLQHGNHDYEWYKEYSLISDMGFKKIEKEGLYISIPIKNRENVLETKEFLSRMVISLYKELSEKNKVFIEIIN